jgi:hypothetical protein
MNLPLPSSAAARQPVTVASLMERLPVQAKLLVQDVIDYSVAMSSKKRITEDMGVRQQVKLYNALLTLINKVEESHRLAYAAVLLVIEENRQDAFHEFHAFRFGDAHRFLTKEKRKTFRTLLHLFINVSVRETRAMMLRQMDLDKMLRDQNIQDSGRERIKSFLEQFKK